MDGTKEPIALTIDMLNEMSDIIKQETYGYEKPRLPHNERMNCKHQPITDWFKGDMPKYSIHLRCSDCGSVISYMGTDFCKPFVLSIVYSIIKDESSFP